MESNKRDKIGRARKKVEQLKGFYVHFTVYVIVNLFIMVATVVGLMNAGRSFSEALFNFGTFATPIFWGIGLAFHAAKTFGFSPFFSKDWEERKIKEFMDEDKNRSDKYR